MALSSEFEVMAVGSELWQELDERNHSKVVPMAYC